MSWVALRCTDDSSTPTSVGESAHFPPDLASASEHGLVKSAATDNAATQPSDWQQLAATALDNPDPALRLEAAHQLGELGDALSMQILEHALYDPDKRVRIAAIDALSLNLGSDTQDILVRAQANDDVKIRNLAYDLLEELRAEN